MKNQNTWLIIGLLALLPTTVSASYIQLLPQISAPDIIQTNTIDIPLTLTNHGDESAYNIQLSLLLPNGFTTQNKFYREIKPNETKEDTFTVNIPSGTTPGSYVFGLLTQYADANQYPFSSVNSLLVNYRIPTMSKIVGGISNANIKNQPTDVTISLRNRDEKEHPAAIKLIIPSELMADNIYFETTLNPNEEKQIPLTISSSSALPGSIYPILAIVTYIENNEQYSTVLRGVLQIEETKQISKNPLDSLLWLSIAVIILIVLFVIYLVYKRRKKKTRRR
ncbi:MAG: NEW3 domain-containing protein [Candidatus Altiarchaeota archaeon]